MREEGGEADYGDDFLGEEVPTKREDVSTPFKPLGKRSRSITPMRTNIYGVTPKCDGCKYGTYSHTQECRARFNDLLDNAEPLSGGKRTLAAGEAPKDGGMGVSSELLPARSAEREDYKRVMSMSLEPHYLLQ